MLWVSLMPPPSAPNLLMSVSLYVSLYCPGTFDISICCPAPACASPDSGRLVSNYPRDNRRLLGRRPPSHIACIPLMMQVLAGARFAHMQSPGPSHIDRFLILCGVSVSGREPHPLAPSSPATGSSPPTKCKRKDPSLALTFMPAPDVCLDPHGHSHAWGAERGFWLTPLYPQRLTHPCPCLVRPQAEALAPLSRVVGWASWRVPPESYPDL